MPDKPRTFEAHTRIDPLELQRRPEEDEEIETRVFSPPMKHVFQIPREAILRLIGCLKQK